MNIDTLEQNLRQLVTNPDADSFLYDLLLAYEQPRSAITRLQKGGYNIAKRGNDVLWKKKVYFSHERHLDLHAQIDTLQQDETITRHHPRFLVVTNLQQLVAMDTKTQDTLDIALTDLPKHFDFFLPWAGMEKTQFQSENPADVKAAERMGRLYDIIYHDNLSFDRHALNIFLSRLLFCFFAEDTGIFRDGQFTNAVGSHTTADGSDLAGYLYKLFQVLALQKRDDFPAFLQAFPYVNGGLFEKDFPVPQFSAKSRKLILECGALNWKAINPDIFGSMIQAVVHDEQRSHLGMHYTSVVNIMKVIEPLFLNDLKEDMDKAAGNENKLSKLLDRLYHLRIFDPACGSGNFLIIAYKELCKLEIQIFRELQTLNTKWKTAKSGIRLTQFYGIELDDFAHETAKLSLWLAEHQMNMAFREVFGDAKPTLPLQSGGNIVCGNATRINWETVCPKDPAHETYILGNPPYLGSKVQDTNHKKDMEFVFNNDSKSKAYDYIFCWFMKAATYIKNENSKFAFVSTNSICQGEQIVFWKNIEKLGEEIYFAHDSFKWKNNAKANAGVICVIVGVKNKSEKDKYIFYSGIAKKVRNINSYLLDAPNVTICRSSSSISGLPPIFFGSIPYDGGQLFLTSHERNILLKENPNAEKFVRLAIGSAELIKGIERWCLWINDEELEDALKIAFISKRIGGVKIFRAGSKTESTNKAIESSHKFKQYTYKESSESMILIPRVSSERREYLPIKFYPPKTVAVDAQVIYDAPIHIFAILSSKIHLVWVRVTSGRMKSDIRYSSAVSYNNFPFPDISAKQKEKLEDHVFRVLDEREKHPEKTMAQLYDPDKMPEALRQAHHDMDIAIEQCYRAKPFTNDEERLEYLFKLYEEMIAAESKGGKK